MQDELVIHKIFSNVVSSRATEAALKIRNAQGWSTTTYKELYGLSRKIAVFLLREGFNKGDFAVLIAENGPMWPAIYLGIMQAGLACVPLDCQLTRQEIKNLVTDSLAKIVFCSGSVFAQKFAGENYPLRCVLIEDLGALTENVSDDSSFPEVAAEDTASLIYTSGTTASPKGVLLTHKNICANFSSIEKLKICRSSDNFLSILPLHHTYSFMVTLIVPLLLGAKITYCPSLKSTELARTIRDAGVTVLAAVPQLIALLHKAIYERLEKIPSFFIPLFLPFVRKKIKQEFKSLRMLVSGGARLEPKINRDLTRLGFKIVEGYGLTETSPIVTLNPPQDTRFGSAGKPIPGVEIRIDVPDKYGIGEVLIKGPNVMQGYFKHPELTGQAIRDGWFYSGDLGRIDHDGYLYLTGRKKDVIVLSSGKNIYPEELEEYYGASSYIKEICVLSRKVEKFGRLIEALYAVIVPNLDLFSQKKESDIRGRLLWELENLAQKAPSYKHIMGFVVTKDGLPRTALKKIKRFEVARIYLDKEESAVSKKHEAIPQEDQAILKDEPARTIVNYISAQLKRPVFLDSHLEIDLGIDSLSRVELGLGLEAVLKIRLPEELLYHVSTVGGIVSEARVLLEQQKGAVQRNENAPREWGLLLKELPDKAEFLEHIRLSTGLLDKLLVFIVRGFILFILRLFWRLNIRGRDNLPKDGPYLICPNHASYLDGFVVFAGVPFSAACNLFSLGASDILEHPLFSWSLKAMRLIPIDPTAHLIQALECVSFVLQNKKIACVFPEGRRAVDENVAEFKKGVGILIKELDIPVIPVYIKGSHNSWPRGSFLPRFCRLEIVFGRPFKAGELIESEKGRIAADDYQAIAQGLREEVLRLA